MKSWQQHCKGKRDLEAQDRGREIHPLEQLLALRQRHGGNRTASSATTRGTHRLALSLNRRLSRLLFSPLSQPQPRSCPQLLSPRRDPPRLQAALSVKTRLSLVNWSSAGISHLTFNMSTLFSGMWVPFSLLWTLASYIACLVRFACLALPSGSAMMALLSDSSRVAPSLPVLKQTHLNS